MSAARRFGGAGIRRGIRSPSGGVAAPALPDVFDADWDASLGLGDISGGADTWTDQIGGEVLTATSAGARPAIGSGALTFDGGDVMQGAFSSLSLSAPFSIITVLDCTLEGGTQGVAYDGDDSGARTGLYRFSDGEWRAFSPSEIDSGVSTGGLQAVVAVYNGASSKIYVDNLTTPAGSGNTGAQVLNGLTVGGSYAGLVRYAGDISRVLIADLDVTSNLGDIGAYLAARYPGLSLTF